MEGPGVRNVGEALEAEKAGTFRKMCSPADLDSSQ